MSIRFKFRSSASFDSVDLGGRPSISVRELRLKIILDKNLNICQDFDLVFSDAVSGEEYNDEKFQIPSGASIIVKRVPAGTVPSANAMHAVMTNDFGKQVSDHFNPLSAKVDDFDDFGTDMCLPLGKPLYESDPECNKKNCSEFDEADVPGSRFECQKLESSDLSQAIHKGSMQSMNGRNIVQEVKAEDQKLEKVVNSNFCAVEHANLPVELECPLCNAYFKEAVLIPCCQHSFCKKCISFVLLEKKSCPICFSSKCRVGDLLPNLSLRQAIEHFLGSQMCGIGTQNDLCKLVPDGESGIQAKDISCAVTVIQREPEIPHSPSATGHGSNQVLADSFYESLRRNTSQKMHLFDGQRAQYANLNLQGGADGPITNFQGENQPLNLLHTHVHDEAESTMKRKGGPLINTGGVETNFWTTGRPKKGGRNCYVCGSLEHLMRECPFASNPYPMPQTGSHMLMGGMPGYPPPYWNSSLYSHVRPFTNMYGNPGMMPFSASMVPPPNFGASPYMPTVHSGIPLNGGMMRKDMMAHPMGNKSEHLLNQRESLELQHHNGRRNVSDENLGRFRGKQCNDKYDGNVHYDYNEKERPKEYKLHKDREASTSYSGDSFGQRSKRKHHHVDTRHERSSQSISAGRDRTKPHMEKSNSGLEDLGHSREKHETHHRDTRKHHEKRGHGGSDSSLGHHHLSKEERRRLEHDVRRSHQKCPDFSDSGSPRNHRAGGKERESGHGSRHSRHNTKLLGNEFHDDYHHNKRKKVH